MADHWNHRVLEFSKGTGFTNGETASIVIGQSSFTTRNPGTPQIDLAGPGSVAFDSSGNLWVSDTGNNRVFEYASGALPVNSPSPPPQDWTLWAIAAAIVIVVIAIGLWSIRIRHRRFDTEDRIL